MEVQINFRVLDYNYKDYEKALQNFLNDLDIILDMTKESIVVTETEEDDNE